jgi:predicted phage terminase large subunit-like protein
MLQFGLVIGDTATQAYMHLGSLKAELESNSVIHAIYGDPIGSVWKEDQIIINGRDEAGNKTEMMIIAVGAGMKVRGLRYKQYRPQLAIIDDLENDEAVASGDRRQKLMNWLTRALLPAMSHDGRIIMIGTILHHDSLLKNVLDRKGPFAGWDTRLYKALDDQGQSRFPELYSTTDVLRMRDDPTYEKYLGPLAFSQEMMNEPVPEEDQIFKPEWLAQTFKLEPTIAEYRALHPELMNGEITFNQILHAWLKEKFEQVVAAVDPAISEKTSADYWAMATVGIERGTGHHWILDVVRMREGDPLKQVDEVLNSFEFWNHDKIKIESVAYQKGLYQLIAAEGAKRHRYPPVVPFIPDRDKRRRGIIHSAKFAGGLVHLREDMPNYNAFREETIQFTGKGDAHDDMIDAYMAATEHTVLQRKVRAFGAKPTGW